MIVKVSIIDIQSLMCITYEEHLKRNTIHYYEAGHTVQFVKELKVLMIYI